MIWFDHLASKRGRGGGGRRAEKCRPFSRSAIEWVSDPRSRRRAQNPKKESESDSHHHLMSFSFFKPSRPKTPQEVVKAIRDSLLALDTKTVVEVKALEKVKVFTFIGLYYSWILDSLLIAYCNSLGIVLKLRIVYFLFLLGFGRSWEEFFISERNAVWRRRGRTKCWSSCTVSVRVLQRRCYLSCHP